MIYIQNMPESTEIIILLRHMFSKNNNNVRVSVSFIHVFLNIVHIFYEFTLAF